MKKLSFIFTVILVLACSCRSDKPGDNDSYWDDTLSVRDSAFTFIVDSTQIDASLMLPANMAKSPLVILQSVMDKDFSLGKPAPVDKDTATVSKPYKDIAIGLAQKGIATLRFGSTLHQRKEINGFTTGMELMNEDLNHALRIAKTAEVIDTSRIYLFSMSNLFISDILKQHPDIKGTIIASTPSRPLMDGAMEMLQTLAEKDTVWQSNLREMEIQYDNLQKLGTEEFDDSIPMPMDLHKDEWKRLKDYSLADEINSLPVPVLVLQGKDDISLSQKEFDT